MIDGPLKTYTCIVFAKGERRRKTAFEEAVNVEAHQGRGSVGKEDCLTSGLGKLPLIDSSLSIKDV